MQIEFGRISGEITDAQSLSCNRRFISHRPGSLLTFLAMEWKRAPSPRNAYDLCVIFDKGTTNYEDVYVGCSNSWPRYSLELGRSLDTTLAYSIDFYNYEQHVLRHNEC